MQVSSVDFIERPALYLDRVGSGSITITKDGHDIAVLTKPSSTPITDSLLGLLRGVELNGVRDIKDDRLGL